MTQKQQQLEAAAPKEDEKKSQDNEEAWAHLNGQSWWEMKQGRVASDICNNRE